MTIAAGTRLGSYEVVAPIGAGGMGEVYRARDSKLGREDGPIRRSMAP
jgi:serine/threonine protein kinase